MRLLVCTKDKPLLSVTIVNGDTIILVFEVQGRLVEYTADSILISMIHINLGRLLLIVWIPYLSIGPYTNTYILFSSLFLLSEYRKLQSDCGTFHAFSATTCQEIYYYFAFNFNRFFFISADFFLSTPSMILPEMSPFNLITVPSNSQYRSQVNCLEWEEKHRVQCDLLFPLVLLKTGVSKTLSTVHFHEEATGRKCPIPCTTHNSP